MKKYMERWVMAGDQCADKKYNRITMPASETRQLQID